MTSPSKPEESQYRDDTFIESTLEIIERKVLDEKKHDSAAPKEEPHKKEVRNDSEGLQRASR